MARAGFLACAHDGQMGMWVVGLVPGRVGWVAAAAEVQVRDAQFQFKSLFVRPTVHLNTRSVFNMVAILYLVLNSDSSG